MTALEALPPPEPADVRPGAGYLLTGQPPARTPAELAAMLRRIGLAEEAVAATAVWLARYESRSAATVRAYVRDCGWWAGWCAACGIDPAAATALQADAYAVALGATGLSAATQVRRLSVASSWVGYLMRAQAATGNPFTGQDRPRVDEHGRGAKALSLAEVEAMLEVAATRYGHVRTRTRTRALIAIAIITFARSASLRDLDYADIGQETGHHTIDLTLKGSRRLRVPLPPFAKAALEDYLDDRGQHPGPLFATATGQRMAPSQVFTTVRRVAELAGATGISPHGLRATGITLALDDDTIKIDDVADQAGHLDVRTTKRYDRKSGRRLARSPAYKLAAKLDHTA